MRLHAVSLLAAVAVVAAVPMVRSSPAAAAAPVCIGDSCSVLFSQPGAWTWTVPDGVTSAAFEVYGAASGPVILGGGLGGEVAGTVPLTSPTVMITNGGEGGTNDGGGQGGRGANGSITGSSGGGFSSVSVGGMLEIVAGGGGGAGAGYGQSLPDGAGGSGGASVSGVNGDAYTSSLGVLGGGQGGVSGSEGGSGGAGGAANPAGTYGCSALALSGASGASAEGMVGGAGADSLGAGFPGGGGGGGYLGGGGGGGGASTTCGNGGGAGGGGGGGASFAAPNVTNVQFTPGVETHGGLTAVYYTLVAPVTSRVTQSVKSWRRDNSLPHISAKGKQPPVGTTFSFTLNMPATVSFAFSHRTLGRKVSGRCVTQTAKNRQHPSCNQTATAGTLTFSAHQGVNRVRFAGRISRAKKLGLGTYTLMIIATDAGQRSRPAMLTFTIVG